MSEFTGQKHAIIHGDDVGTEAFTNEYVVWLENQIQCLLDSEETARGLIANAYDGDWDSASEASGWKVAAEKWRDAYHARMQKSGDDEPERIHGEETAAGWRKKIEAQEPT